MTIVPRGWEPIPSGGSQALMVLDCYAQVFPADPNRSDGREYHRWLVFDGANKVVASGFAATDLEGRLAAVDAVRTMAVAAR